MAEAADLKGSDYSEPLLVTDLSQALTNAYNHNPEIKRARADLEGTNELRAQALSGFLPSASANIGYGHQNTSLGGVKTSGNVSSQTISAEQPLFRGDNFPRMAQTKYLSNAAQYSLVNTEQEVLLSAVSSYMNLITLAGQMEISRNKQDMLYKQYDSARKRYKAGELTKTDVSQAISRLSTAYAEFSVIQTNYENAHNNFERIVGTLPGSLKFPELPALPASVDDALASAHRNNPEVKSAEYSRKAADEAVDANVDSILPTLSLRGAASRETQYSLASGGDYTNNSVTVNLAIPLYQSGEEYSRVRRSKSEASAREFDYASASNNAEEAVKSAWQQVMATTRTIEANEMAESGAKIALDGVRKEESLGFRTFLDVLDAEQELFSAKLGVLNARRDQIIANYTLLARIGKLTAKDLNLPVDYYDPEKHYDDVKNKFIGF